MKKVIQTILDTIVKCLSPVMPLMIAVGMIKVLIIILGEGVLDILPQNSDIYTFLVFVADSGYYFLPIIVGITSGEVFKVNKWLAGMVCAPLIHPTYIQLVADGVAFKPLGLPIAMNNYASQVIPSILTVFIMSYISRYLQKIGNEAIQAILYPPLIVLAMMPIVFCVIGPLGSMVGNVITDMIIKLSTIGALGNAIVCACLPFITIGGLSAANFSAMLLLASTGVDPILFYSNVMYNVILGFVTLALYFRTKRSELIAQSITSAVAGTSEPALFGTVAKDTKALGCFTIACFTGGLLSGLFKVKAYAMASFGFFGIFTTIGKDSSFIGALISMIVASAVGFTLTYLSHKTTN